MVIKQNLESRWITGKRYLQHISEVHNIRQIDEKHQNRKGHEKTQKRKYKILNLTYNQIQDTNIYLSN